MKIAITFISALTLILISSCTKVIDVDLNSKDPQFVIEGYVTLGETVHTVKITKTLNFSQDIDYPTVDNALVVLSDDLGNTQTLTLINPGEYATSGYAVSEGRTYTLTVTVDGQTFVASTKMQQDIPLLSVETFGFAFGPDTINAIVPLRQDLAGVENYYLFHLYNNGQLIQGNFIQSDQYNDGNIMMEPIFADGINHNDTIDVEMFGIDKVVYNFFYTLQQNDQGATPANPDNNFSGKCQGYFCVRTKSVGQIIIP
jgi:hypothetical protein